MATESWVLDGVSLTSGNFSMLELVADPPKSRADWLAAADSENGALMREPFYENRVITMKLRVTQQASMDVALDQVAAIRDKFRNASRLPDGIALVWTPANSSRSRTFDVLSGEITEMPIAVSGQGVSWLLGQRPVFTIEMTCKPYWRGTETLTSTTSSSTPFVTLEIASVGGDAPALGRLIVTDTATQNRRHVEWGLESRNYNASTSLLVDSDNMVTSGFGGAGGTRTGAYDPNGTGNNVITATIHTVPLAVCGVGNLSHVGTFRVKARVFTNVSATRVRIAYRAGDGPLQSNLWAIPPVVNDWTEVDLGLITIPPKIMGTQRWTGQIDAYAATTGTKTLDIDYLVLVPVDEGYGKARATVASGGASAINGRDSFNGITAGTVLNARTAEAGGTWATSGAATDFTAWDAPLASDETMTRQTVSDALPGRYAVLGSTNYTDTAVSFELWRQFLGPIYLPFHIGAILRWTDASNHLRCDYRYETGNVAYLTIAKVVAGTETILTAKRVGAFAAGSWYALNATAFTSGRVLLSLVAAGPYGGSVFGTAEAQDSALATGGTLATGKPGFRDYSGHAAGSWRGFDNFIHSIPPAEPLVVYSGQKLEIRHDDVIRGDSTGTYYGRPQSYWGTRFTVPPGTSRVLVKARRNDVDTTADTSVIDATQIQVGTTLRGLVVPR